MKYRANILSSSQLFAHVVIQCNKYRVTIVRSHYTVHLLVHSMYFYLCHKHSIGCVKVWVKDLCVRVDVILDIAKLNNMGG